MTETPSNTRKRKAEDPLADEASAAKVQPCVCHSKTKRNWDAIARRMTNYEFIKLSISEGKKGEFRILPQIVDAILDIIRARPEHWHVQWRRTETEIQQKADTSIDDGKPIDAQKIHRLLDTAQSTTRIDQRMVKSIIAATVNEFREEAWKFIKAERVRLGRALHHLLGVERERPSTGPDPQVLVHAMLSLAKLSGFEMDSEVFNYVDPGLHDVEISSTSPGFRALRSQMLRVVLYYEDHHAYLDLMDEIISAFADGTRIQEESSIEDSDSGNDSES